MLLADAWRATANWEQLASRDSFIHRKHSAAKIFVTLFYLFIIASIPAEWLALTSAFCLYPLALLIISRTPILPLLKRLLFVLPLIFFTGVGLLWLDRAPATTWNGTVFTHGQITFASLILKTVASVSAALLLTATTRFAEICGQLARWRVPTIFTLQLAITYRYLGTLFAETGALLTAYQLRSPNRTAIWWRDGGTFCGQLLTRSIARAERIHQAMRCRGFAGNFPESNYSAAKKSDYLYAITLGGAMLFARFFSDSVFGI